MHDDQGKRRSPFRDLAFAAAGWRGEPVLNDELAEARWLRPSELRGLKTTEGLAEIVAAALRNMTARSCAHRVRGGLNSLVPRRPRSAAALCVRTISVMLKPPPSSAVRPPRPFAAPRPRARPTAARPSRPNSRGCRRSSAHCISARAVRSQGRPEVAQRNAGPDRSRAQAPDRRAKLIASFNRGYRGFQQTYRTCTPAADVAIRRYLDEGAKISREITARYTN